MILFLLFLQINLIIFLLVLILFKRKPLYSSGLLSFCQILIIFVVIFNRFIGQGFSLLFFTYITAIPAIILIFSKLLAKRKKETWIKKISLELYSELDQSFFNLLSLNAGIYYLSRKAFKFLVLLFIEKLKKPYDLLIKLLIIPWIIFIIGLIYEIVFFQHIYFSAVLLTINLLVFRLTLLLFRIVEFACLENLGFLNTFYFLKIDDSDSTNISIYFQENINLVNSFNNLLQEKEVKPENLLSFWKLFYCGINLSGCYFMILFARNLWLDLRFYLNILVFLVTFLGWLTFSKISYFSIAYLQDVLFIIIAGFIVYFVFRLLTIKQFFSDQMVLFSHNLKLNQILTNFRQTFLNFGVFDIDQLNVDLFHIYPFNNLRPENIVAFFTPIEILFSVKDSPQNSKNLFIWFFFFLSFIIFLIFDLRLFMESLSEFFWTFENYFSFFSLPFLIKVNFYLTYFYPIIIIIIAKLSKLLFYYYYQK